MAANTEGDEVSLPAAKTLRSILELTDPREAADAFAAFIGLHTQRMEDTYGPQNNWGKLKDDLYKWQLSLAEVLVATLQQRIFETYPPHGSGATHGLRIPRRNAWLLLSQLVYYVSKPGLLRPHARSVLSAVRYELWKEMGWVYFAELAYFLVRWRQQFVGLLTTRMSSTASGCDRRTSYPTARDYEASHVIVAVLPQVLRYVPAQTWSALGARAPHTGTQSGQIDLQQNAVPATREALLSCFVAHTAWRHPESLVEATLVPNQWRDMVTHAWLDEILLREQAILRPWMMPAITAMEDDKTALEDAVLRETNREQFEVDALRALASLRICRELFVPGPLHCPPLDMTLAPRVTSETGSGLRELRVWKAIFLERASSLDEERVPRCLRVDGGAAARLVDVIHGASLSPLEADTILDRLIDADETLIHRLHLSPEDLLRFHENHSVRHTARILQHLVDTCTNRLPEYMDAFTLLPVTISNLSLVHAVDRELFFRLYTSRVCAQGRTLVSWNDTASERVAELFATFVLRMLDERPTWITNEISVELEAWALCASRVMRPVELYRCLRRRRLSPSARPQTSTAVAASGEYISFQLLSSDAQ